MPGYLKALFRTTLVMAVAPLAMGATISVTTFDDELNSDGDCSLREAVRSANTDTAVDACTAGSGVDTIGLPKGTYTISLSGAENDDATERDLDITDETVIESSNGDATNTRIVPADGYSGRAFQIRGTNNTVTVRDITVQDFSLFNPGGAFHVLGQNLILERVHLHNNRGTASGAIGFSGAAELTMKDSALTDNVSTNSNFGGGALGSNSSVMTLRNVTLLRNHATGNGGAIMAANPGAEVTLDNVTMRDNTADGEGGGVYLDNDVTVAIRNSIIAGNRAGGSGPECAIADGASISDSRDYNLWGNVGICFDSLGSNSSQTDDPLLALAGTYEGSTPARPPLSGSPAIDGGNCERADGTDIAGDTDQRADAATRDADGDGDGTAGCDIGAIERQRPALTVNATADTSDASPGDGSCADSEGRCTLRAAIDEANARTGLDEILLGGNEYTLSKASTLENDNADGDLDVRDDLILRGQGAAETVIDAAALDRVLHLPGIALHSSRTLAVSQLTLRNGDTGGPAGASTNEPGGAVWVEGSSHERSELLMDLVRLTANKATGISSDGGAINTYYGSLRVTRSTLDGNESERSGSAITMRYNLENRLQSVTITGNTAGNRAAIHAMSEVPVHLERVTIADNEALSGTAIGGAGFFTVHNSIIGAGSDNPCDFYSNGEVTSQGYNLEEGTDCGFSQPTDQTGANAGLGEMASGSSPVPLLEPQTSSKAVGNGHCQATTGYILPTVVFNGTRPQDAAGSGNSRGDGSYGCDIGAAERQSVAVTLGGDSPGDREIALPSEEVVVAQFTLANEAGEPLNGRVIALSMSGTGDESADITSANLYIDNNGDGALDDNDTLVDSVSSLEDDGEIRFEFSGSESAVPSGGELQLIVTYRFSDSLASVGPGTMGATAHYAGTGLLGLFVLAAFAPFRCRRVLLLIAIVALAGCSGGGGGGGDEGDDTTPDADPVSRTYSLSLESLSVEGGTGGELRIRTEPVPGNTLTVTD